MISIYVVYLTFAKIIEEKQHFYDALKHFDRQIAF
jgi:hypothetical protein